MVALSISGFERINERAFTSICQSLAKNQGIQTLDMGNLCQWQLDLLNDVNKIKELDKQILMIPPQRIVPPSTSYLEHIQSSKDDLEKMLEE